MRRREVLTAAAVLVLRAAAGPALAQDRPPLTGRFLLEDQDGRPVDQDSYGGRLRLMTFGYTYCPDICPTTLATMAAALDRLGPQAAQVVPIFVSVDPGRDTPAHLKQYLAAFGPRFVGLTGTPAQVADAARNFRVRYAVRPAENGDPAAYTVDHTAGIYVMDRQGLFLAKLGHLEGAEGVAERLRSYLG